MTSALSPASLPSTRSSEDLKPGSFTNVRTIGVFSLGAIAFFNVSGGPFGSEEMYSAGGPLWGIIGMIMGLFCWAIPLSFMTAELSSAFPYNGGYSLWVKAAFGKFWGVQESYWSWVSGVVDNAVYPVIIFQTISNVAPDSFGAMSAGLAWLFKAALCVIFSIPMLFSIKVTGVGLLQMSVFVIVPFIVFIIWGLTKADLSVLGETLPTSEIDWVNWAIVCFWNMAGVDCVSTVAGETKRPSYTVIRALLGCMVIVTLQYFFVLSTAAGIDGDNWQNWEAGALSGVAKRAFGDWFGWWLVAAAIVGSAGQYVAELLEDSYQICGMARAGLAPGWFGYLHPRYRTPWFAIFFQLVVICALVSFDFNAILAVDSFMSCLSALLEVFALIKLRWSQPNLERPFKIPIKSFWWLLIALTPCLVFGSFVVIASFIADWLTLILNCVVLVLGIPLGWLAVKHADKLGIKQNWEDGFDAGLDEVHDTSSDAAEPSLTGEGKAPTREQSEKAGENV
ncbi:hypothetical protein FOL47_000612 [Perkinsus chesapeaki]|uniref:Amino acid permease n=1 Tax=Perkinsus chesapeaki TaxID=330153 RepID=A0A7J6MME0_PERCH|nr:hypothetical protein FOL47_000612 [Perkinsus chesapeaki]